jgi:protein-S-isoprenylcysteine O-methyltransferase Ste14
LFGTTLASSGRWETCQYAPRFQRAVSGTLAILLARMNAEEALLESEFGEEYASYRRRT